MAFDPEALIALARELASEGATEVRLRAAVGRAYYAVFHVAREKTNVVSRENVHAAVGYQVTRRYGTIVGDKLERLRRLREAADYEFPATDEGPVVWNANWDKAQLLADQVLEKLRARR